MKKALLLLMSISFCLIISAQHIDRTLAATGNFIAYKLDSNADNKIHFLLNRWGHTIYKFESPKAFKYNCIVESEDSITNTSIISGNTKHNYKYLKHNLSLKNYSYQKTDKYSPLLAGLLAIVPSAGHFYINEPTRGLVYLGSMGTSFLLMTGGLILAFDGSVLGTSIMLIGAVGFVGLYIMNINNAVKFAKLKNLAIRNKYISFKVLPDIRINNNVTCNNNIELSLKITF